MSERRETSTELDALVERYWPRLLAYIRTHADPVIRRHESCADVAMSVCREALGEAETFDYRGEPEFLKWLFTKAMAKLVDHKRYLLREMRDPARERPIAAASKWSRLDGLYASIASPSQDAIASEALARFEAAFERLSPEQQHVVTGAKLLGQSHVDISNEIGKSEGAVRVILHRALARVGLWMDEQHG